LSGETRESTRSKGPPARTDKILNGTESINSGPAKQAVSFILHHDLGQISFDGALELQERAIEEYREKSTGLPVIFSLEHNPVITCGRSTETSNLLLTEDGYREHGIDVRVIDRGGDVTYHGPGQAVIYPIIALRQHKLRAGEYVALLEEAMIRTCSDYGVNAYRRVGFPGCWTDRGKIGAIGTAVKAGGITKHGLAFNVSTNLDHFNLIVPCGIMDKPVVRLNDLTDSPAETPEVAEKIVNYIADGLCLPIKSKGDI